MKTGRSSKNDRPVIMAKECNFDKTDVIVKFVTLINIS